jgi:hypothetical protein
MKAAQKRGFLFFFRYRHCGHTQTNPETFPIGTHTGFYRPTMGFSDPFDNGQSQTTAINHIPWNPVKTLKQSWNG